MRPQNKFSSAVVSKGSWENTHSDASNEFPPMLGQFRWLQPSNKWAEKGDGITLESRCSNRNEEAQAVLWFKGTICSAQCLAGRQCGLACSKSMHLPPELRGTKCCGFHQDQNNCSQHHQCNPHSYKSLSLPHYHHKSANAVTCSFADSMNPFLA